MHEGMTIRGRSSRVDAVSITLMPNRVIRQRNIAVNSPSEEYVSRLLFFYANPCGFVAVPLALAV
ncbi:MAG: hypothetical protein L0J14_03320 [Bifidobacterium crudilactis]|nr:hypothetical protein [Bifidobacterium crudilactis]